MRFSIRQRLIAGFGTLTLVVFFGLGISFLLIRSADERTTRLVDETFDAALAAESARAAFYSAANEAQAFSRSRNLDHVEAFGQDINRSLEHLARVSAHTKGTHLEQSVRNLIGTVKRYENTFGRIVARQQERGLDENEGLQGQFRAAVHAIEDSVTAQQLDALTVLMLMARRHEKDYMLRGDEKYIDRIGQRIGEFGATLETRDIDTDLKATMMAQWQNYFDGIQRLVDADRALAERVGAFDALTETLSTEIDTLEADLFDDIADEKTLVIGNMETTRGMLALVLVVSLAISGFVTWWIVNSIVPPLRRARRHVAELAKGNLRSSLDHSSQDEIGDVIRDIESLRLQLVAVMGSINETAREVTRSVSRVTGGNADLSERTQEQASSLEEIAASIEEMTSTLAQNAENANHARKLSRDTRELAEEGGGVVREAISAIGEIDRASNRVEEIIGVIDDIAFQINLLALNAAVEAARAGDQGRGFAVVAGEVRQLAARSAGASKEIRELILDTVAKVGHGTKLVIRSGDRLAEIEEAVTRVSAMVSDIADATQEQTDGIQQINRAISQIDDMTQKNASLVRTVADTADSMNEQGLQLTERIAFFEIESTTTTSITRLELPGLQSAPAPLDWRRAS